MKVLGLIPARAGSKRIPKKNIKFLCGKPLIAWTIETALKSTKLSNVIVSTDDEEIADIAKSYGANVPFMRPSHLSEDLTPGIAPALHALEHLPNYDVILLLQPTSPLRKNEDIDGIIKLFLEKKASSAVSVCEASNHPNWTYFIKDQKLINCYEKSTISRRQELPIAYTLNGALYLASRSFILDKKSFIGESTMSYLMPQNRSIDIDDMHDWRFAEYLLNNNISNNE
jgi:CMP-N-acetylneuraminic acid synthetase